MGVLVAPPVDHFTDTNGQPLENGKIYIGTQFLNAETNPIATYWDSALTVTAPQPIRTSGGYPFYQGVPAPVYVTGDYSITVRDKNDKLVMSNLNAATLTPNALLALIKTVDGAGSGLDADTVDGLHAVDFTDPVQLSITEAGLTYDSTDKYQLSKALIALSHVMGENIFTDQTLTQVIYSAAKSTASPGNPQYLPIISRAVDKTVTTAMSLPLVTAYRAFTANVLGTTTFVGTVAASVITFSITTTNTAMLNALVQHGLARRWFSSSQSATFAGSGADYTNVSINVAGTDFSITAINVGAGTVTVSGTPTAGVQNCILYPYRVVGSSTSVFLPRLAGFVPVAHGDDDGVEINGYLHMDQIQGHWHSSTAAANTIPRGYVVGAGAAQTVYSIQDSASTAIPPTYISDLTNGTPRTGKVSNARSATKNVYTWAGVLTAAV
jgi:hypothetical protein